MSSCCGCRFRFVSPYDGEVWCHQPVDRVSGPVRAHVLRIIGGTCGPEAKLREPVPPVVRPRQIDWEAARG